MNNEEIIQHLFEQRKRFSEITKFSSCRGIYAFFYDGKVLPHLPEEIPENEILYIGKAEKSSLQQRIAQTHFENHRTCSSTVRRSFGSILREKLSLKPIPGNKSCHFRFDEESEDKLTEWMNSNLSVSFYEFPKTEQEMNRLETNIIRLLMPKPKLNIQQNPNNPFRKKLKKLRKECASEAHSFSV